MKMTPDLETKLSMVWPLLDERTRRLIAAGEARALGHGGITKVSRACGLSRKAITSGIKEIEEGKALSRGITVQNSKGTELKK